MNSKRVWIIEIWAGGQWEPTTGVALDEADTVRAMRRYRRNYPRDELRWAVYGREGL